MTPLVFFSFVNMPGCTPEQHRDYNRWHQLDHRPINLALPGVAWGDRWSRPDEYQSVGVAEGDFATTDYIAMYWFNEPVAQSVEAWTQLGEDSFQLGRGPIIPGVSRSLLAFFRPVKGYAAPRALVAADELPYRPNRGLHVTLTRYADHHSLATHDRFTWHDRVLLPRLVEEEGVAGGWTFAYAYHQRHKSLTFGTEKENEYPGSMRMRLLYLEDDPLAVTARLAAAEAEAEAELATDSGAGAEEVLFSGPVKTIIPWQDW